MIAPLLNREFLLGQAAEIRHGLSTSLAGRQRRGGRRTGVDALSDAELRNVIEALERLGDKSEGLAEAAGGGEPGTEGARPKDDYAFVPQDQLLSIVQTCLETYFEERQPKAIQEKRRLDDRRGAAPDPVVSDVELKGVRLTRTPDDRRLWKRMEIGGKRSKYFVSDPRWVLSAVAMAWTEVSNQKAGFVDEPRPPVRIGNDARILLVGDWGSGIKRARTVAKKMREALDAPEARGMDRHVIHLGDVYYSGGRGEYQKRFLAPWPVVKGEDIGSFSLMGNHDMYLGGEPYYDTCLADPRFERQGGCSYFALHNDHWQLFGLDSSFTEKRLHGGQLNWAMERIAEVGEGVRTAVMTHHQLWSTHEAAGETLGTDAAPLLDHGVDAWFWGHEHRCILYGEHRGVKLSSCIGHGGIPEYMSKEKREPLAAYEYEKRYGKSPAPWNTFGFAILDLRGEEMTLTYVDEHGDRHHTVPDAAKVPA